MIPTSEGTPDFITRQPSWEIPVDLELSQDTSVFTSRAGLEERQRRRAKSRVELTYSAVLMPGEAIVRDATAIAGSNKACIVPIWTERALTTSGIVANVVSIDRTPDDDWFVAGEYAYLFSRSLGGQFRTIASVAGSALTFAAIGGAVAFPAGTAIYPCRLCTRQRGAEWSRQSLTTGKEDFRFTSL